MFHCPEKNVDFATSSTICTAVCCYGYLVAQICNQWVVTTQILRSRTKWDVSKMLIVSTMMGSSSQSGTMGEVKRDLVIRSAKLHAFWDIHKGKFNTVIIYIYIIHIDIDGRKKHIFSPYMTPSTYQQFLSGSKVLGPIGRFFFFQHTTDTSKFYIIQHTSLLG